jgi:hypothetical protein
MGSSAKVKFITRAEARRRAVRHVARQMFKGATVEDGATVQLRIYGFETLKDTWVVYKSQEQGMIKSSEVVLVSKRTGRVVYEGPTQDEG